MAPSPPSSRSSKAQELQLPNETGEIFLLFSPPCKAPPGTAEPAWQEAARGGAAQRRSPSRPRAFASSSPKTCPGQPLNICRAAPLAPHLLFRQTFPPISGPPAALVFSSNLLLHPTLQSISIPTSSRLPDTARAGRAATSTRLFSCKIRIWETRCSSSYLIHPEICTEPLPGRGRVP